MAKTTYHHLTQVQRCRIEAQLSSGASYRMIARKLQLAPSTVSREVRRNRQLTGRYDAEVAQRAAAERRQRASAQPRKVTDRHLDYIYDRLEAGHSPDVISHVTTHPQLKLSTAWIYELLSREVAAGDDDWTSLLLRKFRKRRGPRRGTAGVNLIANRVDIAARPAEVDTRQTFGHWEGDTIVGARHQGAIVTLVERRSRFLVCRPVRHKTKEAVAHAIIAMMRPLQDTVKTITFDNGGEFADHTRIAQQLTCHTFFAKPYHSWQRGTNEHLNGEVRRLHPKGEPLDDLTRADTAFVAHITNQRYRKILGYRTADQCFQHERAHQLE